MGALSEVVRDMSRRRAVIDDAVGIIEAEVAGKRGLSGMAVKGAFKLVKKVRPGFLPMAVDNLLDDFAEKVDPFFDAWREAGSPGTLPGYFRDHASRIASALLEITDERARHAKHRSVKRAYESLRPQALSHTAAAMPRLGELVQRHAV